MKKSSPKLTAAQKRVAIAKDVLKQIKACKYVIKTGRFAYSAIDVSDHTGYTSYNQRSVRNLKCQVCAAGAAIISAIRLFDKLDLPVIDSPHPLKQFFSAAQVKLIELSFECGGGFYYATYESQIMQRAVAFGVKRKSFTKRAQAIFRNIIANKGEFVP